MGKDLSPHEAGVLAVVSVLVGSPIRQFDDNTTPRMVDGVIEHEDGRRAAIEVTRVIDPNELKLESITGDTLPVPGTDRWMLIYPLTVTIRDLRKYGPALVAECEAVGVNSSALLPASSASLTPARSWAYGNQISVARVGASLTGAGELSLHPNGFGGLIRRDLPELESWLVSQTTAPWFVDNRDKLVASGLDELHLAVTVHASAMPGDLLISLMEAETVSTTGTLPLAPLTDLWLLVPVGGRILHLQNQNGWSVHPWPL
ncbi:hypothetical protein IC607_08675 [Cellulomonas sp. JH27-2]|uniref:hypothetical protein n=1 Tax=Cellulomonas sp. JH27-2 TaxID=2774139 RepID=UPI0017860747|nr:hypothetical protein [Cellulomonas sp. JH27-2]MBD8059041.1 hypothetical protein [Cellulomonas sp. JH27-2]